MIVGSDVVESMPVVLGICLRSITNASTGLLVWLVFGMAWFAGARVALDGDGLLVCCSFGRRDDAANVNFGALGQLTGKALAWLTRLFSPCVGLLSAGWIASRFLCLMAERFRELGVL